MPKKIKLTDLNVQSFVTSLEKETEDKVKGGASAVFTCTLFKTLCYATCGPDTSCGSHCTCYISCGGLTGVPCAC